MGDHSNNENNSDDDDDYDDYNEKDNNNNNNNDNNFHFKILKLQKFSYSSCLWFFLCEFHLFFFLLVSFSERENV
jgi:hypothetical protein